MNEEQLLGWFEGYNGGNVCPLRAMEVIKSFLSNKVIIEKGVNPHPDAYLLHQWVEGTLLEKYQDSLQGLGH